MRKAHDKQNIADAQHAPDGKHHRHRRKGLAGAAADGGNCVGIGQQKEEQRNGPGLLCGKRDNVGRFAEKTGQLRHEGIHGKANELGENDRREDAEPGALFCPAIFARAEVLAGIGSERHGKASDRQERKAFKLAVGAVGGHCDFSEGIDVGLYHDIGKADHGVLDAGWKAVADNLPEHLRVKAELFPLQMKGVCLDDGCTRHRTMLMAWEIVVATAADQTPQ